MFASVASGKREEDGDSPPRRRTDWATGLRLRILKIGGGRVAYGLVPIFRPSATYVLTCSRSHSPFRFQVSGFLSLQVGLYGRCYASLPEFMSSIFILLHHSPLKYWLLLECVRINQKCSKVSQTQFFSLVHKYANMI